MLFLADLILMLHFFIVIFITLQFFTVPVAYKLNWKWQKNRVLRIIHLIMIFFVTTEAVIGITCPLTIIENKLRNIYSYNTFLENWISKIMFWNLPSYTFMILYILCLFWTLLMWKIFPPNKSRK